MTRDELIDSLKRQRPLFDREKVASVSLFGSRARQSARADSDVDLLVGYAPGAPVSLIDLVRLEAQLSNALALNVQVVTAPIERERLRRNIEADRINVF